MSELDPGFVFFLTIATVCAVGMLAANLASACRRGRRRARR